VLGRGFHGHLLPRHRMADQITIIQTTLPIDWLEAEVGAFSQQLVDAGAGCVQHERIRSTYRWGGEIQSAEEWRLQVKVQASKVEDVVSSITNNHPYDTPQIIWFSAHAEKKYLEWIAQDSV